MKTPLLIAAAPIALGLASASAEAQSHQHLPGMHMPGMQMPTAPPAPVPEAKKPRPAKKARGAATPPPAMSAAPATAPETQADHGGMPGMPMPAQGQAGHGGHVMAGMDMPAAPRGTDLAPGNAPPPPVQPGRPADRYYDPGVMAEAEMALLNSHGSMVFHQFLANLAEYQVRNGKNGYRWDGELWVGGDLNRLVVKSEGEASFKDRVDSAEVQALFSRALDPYWNLQVGLRQDFAPKPVRTYAVLGIEGLAPNWLETEGALFLSDKGQLLGRVTGSYDQRITTRIILQPRVEANFSLQDMPHQRIGAGVSNLELGLRLRYEIKREFAPYVGVSWDRKLGKTADFARAAGEGTGGASFVAGIHFWF